MQFIYAILLGIIQGITEWLPVSSSGHLAIFQSILGITVPVLFDVILHVATLFVIFVVFNKDIVKCLQSLFRFDWKSEYGLLNKYLIIATIPTAIIGYLFHDLFVSFFTDMKMIAFAFLFTGCVLFATKFAKSNKKINIKNSLLIGIAQAIAIAPGVSRSGMTISAGLLSGIDKKNIVRFSFLLAIPAIIGAFIFEMKDLAGLTMTDALTGFIASFIVGYFSLKLLLKIINKNKFWMFCIYCWFIGILLLII